MCDGILCEDCDPLEDPELQKYLAACEAECKCCDRCCSSACAGVLQGGVCDDSCHCEEEGDYE